MPVLLAEGRGLPREVHQAELTVGSGEKPAVPQIKAPITSGKPRSLPVDEGEFERF